MASLTVVVKHERGRALEPETVAAVSMGIADLCRHQDVRLAGERVEVRARILRITRSSLKFHFDLEPLLRSASDANFGWGVAGSIAASLILDALKWLYSTSDRARTARSRELADSLKSPEVVGVLKEIFSALQQDDAVTALKVEANDQSVLFDGEAIKQADQFLDAQESSEPRSDDYLWGKHVRIIDIVGEGSSQEWRLHWENPPGTVQESWVKSVRPPSGSNWRPGINRTMVVDVRIRHRPGRSTVESAEILNVHWAQMH